jgi:hypothetical protein
MRTKTRQIHPENLNEAGKTKNHALKTSTPLTCQSNGSQILLQFSISRNYWSLLIFFKVVEMLV